MNDKDLNIVYTRGSGPGGQHKNKVETCVVVTHMPTGLSIRCQDTRSKIQNLKLAKVRLSEKIVKFEQDKIQVKKKERRDELVKNSKVIRTYNFNRNEVYDHRTKTRYDLKKFMRGEIDM